MEKQYIIALDQGTTSSRAVLLDKMPMWLKWLSVNLPRFIRKQAG